MLFCRLEGEGRGWIKEEVFFLMCLMGCDGMGSVSFGFAKTSLLLFLEWRTEREMFKSIGWLVTPLRPPQGGTAPSPVSNSQKDIRFELRVSGCRRF